MSALHPTKRDFVLILSCVCLLTLLLQFDFAQRVAAPSRFTTDSEEPKSRWLDDVMRGARASEGRVVAGMAQAKVRWTDAEGPPQTEVLAHAPGWTIFDDLFLFNGTWFIVTNSPSKIPLLRMMASTGKEIWNDEESIKGREPTEKDMRIIFPSDAEKLWGHTASRVSGATFLVNDPPQFLDHYYHFAAELLVGLWRTYSSLDPTIDARGHTHLPSPSRMLFPNTAAGKWNDYAKMNSFLSRAIFPSMSYEYQNDFMDRADTARAFLFERVVFADRAAAFRGPEFAVTWRTASEAVTLQASEYWWAPIRRNLLDFVGAGSTAVVDDITGVGVEEDTWSTEVDVAELEAEEESEETSSVQEGRPKSHSNKPVITYVSRQDWGRRMLRKKDHEELVAELDKLKEKYGWEINIVSMDKLSRDEQIRLAGRTTVMMGVHGNGLTHLLWMNAQNPRATVIEFFYPGGFAEDYEFTTRALGMRHYGFWDDKHFTAPDTPQVAYPEGFQGNDIPLSGKAVAELIVERLLIERERDLPSVA